MVKRSALQPSAGSVASSGAMAATTTVVATRTSGARGKIQLGPFGSHPLAVDQLPQVEERLSHGGPTRPSIRQRTLRISPMRSGPPMATVMTWSSEIAGSGQDRPVGPHATTTRTMTRAAMPKAR